MTGLNAAKLRLWLAGFFLALAVPGGVLIHQAYSQLKWEAFHQHRLLAEELAARIDGRFNRIVAREEARPFTEYAFLNVAGDPAAGFLQRSPLSNHPPDAPIPGLIGYFQVDADGAFSTPLLPPSQTDPADYGITRGDLERRQQLAARMRQILSANQVVGDGDLPEDGAAAGASEREPAPALAEEAVPARSLFDELSEQLEKKASVARDGAPGEKKRLGRVDDLKLDQRYQSESDDGGVRQRRLESRPTAPAPAERAARTEQSALPDSGAAGQSAPSGRFPVRIRTFESEVDPFGLSMLDSGHFVLFRKVWREGRRYVQGVLLEQQAFLRGVAGPLFREAALFRTSDLVVAYRGEVVELFGGAASGVYRDGTGELEGTLLYRSRLSAPLGELELLFSLRQLPPGPGATVLAWLTVILIVVLCGGLYLMYRLGMTEIRLARQQQDFVSAVSHELKTPLTSIRMYGEMLREGWVPEGKRREYYAFIHDESERLSRLINNVLQLSRMARREPRPALQAVSVSALIDALRSKVASQVERAGFALNIHCSQEAAQTAVMVDTDLVAQVFINLVDNAVKFSAAAEHKAVDVACRLEDDGNVRFSVRDYGPGIPKSQMKKIFMLFFRPETGLTRQTTGTGIGLALVEQLVKAMHGAVDVVNRDPGAEFSVTFEAVNPAQSAGASVSPP